MRPISLREANRFVDLHHRHNGPARGHLFSVGLEDDEGDLVGVGIASRPVARRMQDGFTFEVVRVCTQGHPNANSMIYARLTRAARALGYRRGITYTLESEPGTSLKAAGWVPDAEVPAAPTWSRQDRPRDQTDLFGEERRPPEAKRRWRIDL